MDNMDRSKN